MIPLGHFRASFDVLALCSHFPFLLGCLPSLHDGQVCLCFSVPSLLQPLLLYLSDHPMSYTILHPSSYHDQFSRHIAVLIRPRFVGFLAWVGSSPHSFLQLLTLVLDCPSLPVDYPCLLQKHRFHVLWADHSHVHRHLLLNKQSVPLGPLDAKVTGCTSNLCFLDAFCCSLLHLLIHTPSAEKSVAKVDKSSSTSNPFTSMQW